MTTKTKEDEPTDAEAMLADALAMVREEKRRADVAEETLRIYATGSDETDAYLLGIYPNSPDHVAYMNLAYAIADAAIEEAADGK